MLGLKTTDRTASWCPLNDLSSVGSSPILLCLAGYRADFEIQSRSGGMAGILMIRKRHQKKGGTPHHFTRNVGVVMASVTSSAAKRRKAGLQLGQRYAIHMKHLHAESVWRPIGGPKTELDEQDLVDGHRGDEGVCSGNSSLYHSLCVGMSMIRGLGPHQSLSPSPGGRTLSSVRC